MIHPQFALDPRNVRLALTTDGFNPFGIVSASHSAWPIILIPYNTHPWVCMKHTSFIISMIIPRKKMPENDIYVYLQPLIKELNELWSTSVDAYNSFKREMFKFHVALIWTISDFPGLGSLSGWSTYTGLASPSCNFDFILHQLCNGMKFFFMGHHHFLDQRRRFRLHRVRFNGKQEMRSPPKVLSSVEILEQVQYINVTFGRNKKEDVMRKRTCGGQPA